MADTFQRMLGNNGSKMAAQLTGFVEAVAGNSACWFACSGLVSARRVWPNESPEPVDAYEAEFALLRSRALPVSHAIDMARLFINFKLFLPCEIFNSHHKVKHFSSDKAMEDVSY
jgi:hypothetical protein